MKKNANCVPERRCERRYLSTADVGFEGVTAVILAFSARFAHTPRQYHYYSNCVSSLWLAISSNRPFLRVGVMRLSGAHMERRASLKMRVQCCVKTSCAFPRMHPTAAVVPAQRPEYAREYSPPPPPQRYCHQ